MGDLPHFIGKALCVKIFLDNESSLPFFSLTTDADV